MRVIGSGLRGTIGQHVKDVEPFHGDIRDGSSYSQLNQFDSFLHLGGIVGAQKVQDNPRLSYDVNVSGTLELAREVLRLEYKQFIYVSSSHVYGDVNGTVTEEHVVNPLTAYAEQKVEVEEELRDLFRSSGTNLVVIRLFSILGNGMPELSLGGLLDRIIRGENHVVGNSDDVRDFLSPIQAAKGLKLIAAHDWSDDNTYNLCTSKGLTVKEASQLYFAGREFNLADDIYKTGTSKVARIVGDNSKLLKALPGIATHINEFMPSKSED